MKLERTHDMDLVGAIMRHPAIWPHVHDDGVTDWAPIDHEAIHWMLVVLDNGEPGGLFMVHALNSFCYEMHTALLPRMWGAESAKAGQMLAAWVFTETQCRKLVTNVPAYNRAARRFAVAAGGRQEGVNRSSFMRHGVMVDQIFYGITIQEWTSCQQQFQSPPQ